MATATPEESGYTVESYFALVDQGVLEPDDRVELLEGVIVSMPPIGPPHACAVDSATRALVLSLGRRASVRVQGPFIAGPRSVPQPDLTVLPGDPEAYARAHPRAALLAVEVADTSLPQDRLTKSRLYAAAAIPEYWIVNLRDDVVEVMRSPNPQGRFYAERVIARRGDRISPLSFPDVSIAVDDLLPPQTREE